MSFSRLFKLGIREVEGVKKAESKDKDNAISKFWPITKTFTNISIDFSKASAKKIISLDSLKSVFHFHFWLDEFKAMNALCVLKFTK